MDGIVVTASLVSACVAAAAFGPLLLDVVTSSASVRRRRLKMGSHAQGGFEAFVETGCPLVRYPARRLLETPPGAAVVRQCMRVLESRSIRGTAQTVAEIVLLGLVVAFLGAWVVTGSLTGAVVTALIAVFAGGAILTKRDSHTLDAMVAQLPDALHDLGICTMSGLSLSQAFERTSQGIARPLKDEFARVSYDLQTGKSAEEAMDALTKRIPVEEMEYLAVVLTVQRKTGGSLKSLLDRSADAVRASSELRRTLSVQTAQARLSATIVTVLPLGILAIVTCASPGYLDPFFSSMLGWVLLGTAIALEALGLLAIRRILGLRSSL